MSLHWEKIIQLLRGDHPDLSHWTLICAVERAVDPLQYLIHRELGGMLPKVMDLDAYLAEKLGLRLNLRSLPGDEQLVFFIQFMAEQFPEEPFPVRRASIMLPMISKLSQYHITKDTIAGCERFTEEEWRKLEESLDTAQAFREWLGKRGFFMAALEANRLDELTPGEQELFVGLPEMTAVHDRFYRRLRRDRLFIDKPLFGLQLAGVDQLPFDSAKNLVTSFGGEVEYSEGEGIELLSLTGLHDMADLVTREISAFLNQRGQDEQMIIFLLDESLTPMLWNRSLRRFGNAVNLAVWLPFSITAAGKRLLMEIEKARKSDQKPDFKKYVSACAAQLIQNSAKYVREECEALEAAIAFSNLLDHWKERLGRHLNDAAKMLIEAKKFRLTGSRSAPVQIVGFGHASGQRFSRGLILALDSGIMPSQPYEGPFINPVHVPKLRKSVFEQEDLVFRQILSQGKHIKIVGVDDPVRDRTPSYYMTLLSQEFSKPVTPLVFKRLLPAGPEKSKAAIRMDDDLRSRLRNYTYSYSSLTKILSCPFLFYYQYIRNIKPPSFMDDEEKINMQMGTFVHRFLEQLAVEAKGGFEKWEKLFDRMWASEKNTPLRDTEGVHIYMLNAKFILKQIYEDEKASGEPVIFADNAVASEKMFTGMIDGTYRITGVSDRLAHIAGRTDVIDFKYSRKSSQYDLSRKITVLERFISNKVLHPAAQLLIYQYFQQEAEGARFYFLKEPSQDREIALPAEEIAGTESLLTAIRKRLDVIIDADEILPSPECDECEYCRFQAFCGRESYYKTARRFTG